jgi:hypothetical protein
MVFFCGEQKEFNLSEKRFSNEGLKRLVPYPYYKEEDVKEFIRLIGELTDWDGMSEASYLLKDKSVYNEILKLAGENEMNKEQETEMNWLDVEDSDIIEMPLGLHKLCIQRAELKGIQEGKAEAIKEFKEKLEEKFDTRYDIIIIEKIAEEILSPKQEKKQ